MIKTSKDAQTDAVLQVADAMCAAARTAPKTKGQDYLDCCIVSGDDIEKLAQKMEQLSSELGYAFFMRDAQNIRQSQAVVLIGTAHARRGLGDGCGYCHHQNCVECAEKNGVCMYDGIDLGIAIGAAVSVAADHRIDNRVMFSVGRAAKEMNWFSPSIGSIFGIPLSVSKKSPFFDRA